MKKIRRKTLTEGRQITTEIGWDEKSREKLATRIWRLLRSSASGQALSRRWVWLEGPARAYWPVCRRAKAIYWRCSN